MEWELVETVHQWLALQLVCGEPCRIVAPARTGKTCLCELFARPVQPNRIRKSIDAENSYDPDLSDRARILTELETIAQTLKQRIDSKQSRGRTLTLKLKYADYQQVTRSRTIADPIEELDEILSLAMELLALTEVEHKPVRLQGTTEGLIWLVSQSIISPQGDGNSVEVSASATVLVSQSIIFPQGDGNQSSIALTSMISVVAIHHFPARGGGSIAPLPHDRLTHSQPCLDTRSRKLGIVQQQTRHIWTAADRCAGGFGASHRR